MKIINIIIIITIIYPVPWRHGTGIFTAIKKPVYGFKGLMADFDGFQAVDLMDLMGFRARGWL